ncbi:MAG TPA: hypothetical protein VK191_00595, partial [Symbiobacteriaceae bacterium]|nr:hypothetical protein [Symbiobacteriaceae bacterium]
GTYGTLKVESALGYSDGLHAALFTKDGGLDTAVQILKNTDTNVTLPPGTYSLEIQNDTTVKRTGLSITITAGQTLSLAQVLSGGAGNPNAGFSFSSVPANAYPGNRLAIYLDGQDLAANTGYATEVDLLETSSGQSIARRYDRSAQSFAGTAQTLTANASGEVHRWEFWDLDAASSLREIGARVRMNGTEMDSQQLTQLADSTYGYLTVESALGYSDGLHAALFGTGAVLDTAVWLANGANTTVTLPPGTYTLEIKNDTTSKRSNVTVTITAGQTVSLNQIINGGGQPQPGWALSQVPAHAYEGNRLALLLDANGLAANSASSVQGYVYVTGGQQISKRYNRSTQTFIDGLTAQSMTTDAQGSIHRWEFWELTSAGDREINARLKVNGSTKVTETLRQVKSGSFGSLLIPASLGYSDGLHAALFTVGGSLDTTAWIAAGADTSVKLPAGTYLVAIWNDAGAQLTEVSVTITAGQTTSLLTALDATPPTITATRAPAANEYGWTNTAVTVTFSCNDGESGIATCTDPVTVTAEGQDQSVTGTATDNAGNTASLTVTGINIDRSAPTLGIEGARAYTVDELVQITCTATDMLSGLVADPCGAPLLAAPAATLALGQHVVTVTVVDRAGNVREVSATFSIGVTYESLTNLTKQFVTKPGPATSLTGKLDAAAKAAAKGTLVARDAHLNGFVQELKGVQQSGAITAEQAELLKTLAEALKQ